MSKFTSHKTIKITEIFWWFKYQKEDAVSFSSLISFLKWNSLSWKFFRVVFIIFIILDVCTKKSIDIVFKGSLKYHCLKIVIYINVYINYCCLFINYIKEAWKCQLPKSVCVGHSRTFFCNCFYNVKTKKSFAISWS